MTRFCTACGESLDGGEAFCPGCGTRLHAGDRRAALAARLAELAAAPEADPALRLGHLLLAEGDAAGALAAFRLALTADPALAEASLALAVVYLQRGDPQAARPHLIAAIEQAPPGALTASARAYLGIVLLDAYDIGGAQAELAAAERDDPQNFLVLWKRGEYYYRLGMYADAVAALTAALAQRPPGKASMAVVARLLEASREKAERSFTRQPLLPQWGQALRRRFPAIRPAP